MTPAVTSKELDVQNKWEEKTHTHTHTNRIGEGGIEAKKRKKPQNSCRRRAGNGGNTGGKRRNVEKKGLVQQLPTRII